MNRVAAIQKSSRTSTRHCTRAPSHWRRASTSSPSGVSLRACSHCSNWSSTIRTFLPGGQRLAAAQACQRPGQPSAWGRSGQRFASAASSRASVRSGGGLDVDGQHVIGRAGARGRP